MLIALHLSGSLGVFIKKKYVHAITIADSSSFVKEEKTRSAESRKPSVFFCSAARPILCLAPRDLPSCEQTRRSEVLAMSTYLQKSR